MRRFGSIEDSPMILIKGNHLSSPEVHTPPLSRSLTAIIFSVVLVASSALLTRFAECSAQSLATVDGVPINSELYRAHYLRLLESHPNVKGNPRLERRLAERATLPLVVEILLRGEAQRAQVNLDQLKYTDPLIKLHKMYPDEARLKQYLIRIGETKASLRLKRWREAAVRELMERRGLLKVTKEEVRAEYERQAARTQQPDRVQAAQILFALPSEPSAKRVEQQRALAQEVYQKIKSGELTFETAVWKHSEGPRKFKRGSLGMIARGQLVESVEDTIWKLKRGEISQPVLSRYGWHILHKGVEIKGKRISFEESRAHLRAGLTRKRYSTGQRAFIKELWGRAKIVSSLSLRY